ncbi:WD40/YVTN/BNR-like repeat-containing protein [Candidatus Riflebacteria bacterium]
MNAFCATQTTVESLLHRGRWRLLSTGITEADFTGLAINPGRKNEIYIASERTVYKSTDAGENWQPLTRLSGPRDRSIKNLYFDKFSANLFICSSEGLFSIKDGKLKEMFKGIGPESRVVNQIFIIPERRNQYFLATNNGLFFSTDVGYTWKKNTGEMDNLQILDIKSFPGKPGFLICGTENGAYLSKDGGIYFNKIFTRINPQARRVTKIVINPKNAANFYMGTLAGIFVTTNGGLDFRPMNSTGMTTDEITDLQIHPTHPYFLFAATQKGIFSFNPGKKSWEELYFGLTNRQCKRFRIGVSEKNFFLTTQYGVFIFETPEAIIDFKKVDNKKIKAFMKKRVNINDLFIAALDYAGISPQLLNDYRKAAAKRSHYPGLRVSYNYSDSGDEGISSSHTRVAGRGAQQDFSFAFNWKLAETIHDSVQRDLRNQWQKLQKDRENLLDRISKIFFERERLAIIKQFISGDTLMKQIENELQYQELTARLDGISGKFLTLREKRNGNN